MAGFCAPAPHSRRRKVRRGFCRTWRRAEPVSEANGSARLCQKTHGWNLMRNAQWAGGQRSGQWVRMTRECLDRRDRMRIYGTEYARVKRINGKSCCRPDLPRAFGPLLLRTMKREGLPIGDAGKFFASTTASPCPAPTPGVAEFGLPTVAGKGTVLYGREALTARFRTVWGAVPEPVSVFPDGFARRRVPHWAGLAVRQECGMTVSQGKNRSRGKAALPRRRCIHSTGMFPRSRYRLRPCG